MKKKERLKIKEVKKKFQKKRRLKIFKNSLFFSVFSVSVFFRKCYILFDFSSFHEGFFALKIAAFLALFFSTFCRFFVGVTPLRSLLFSVAAVFCLYLPPPLYRRSRNKSNPKKNFFYFF